MSSRSSSRIRPLGSFLRQDAEGFIVALNTEIDSLWRPSIDEAVAWYKREYGTQLHSVYVRGSVAQGRSPEDVSDLDLIALLGHNAFRTPYIAWEHVSWESAFSSSMQASLPRKCRPDFVVASLNKGFLSRNNGLPMAIATQSVCVHGTNIIPRLPKYRPGPDMMYYNGRMSSFIQLYYASLQETDDIGVLTDQIRRVLKAIIRCAFELFMQEEGRYTRDLYLCCQVFEKHAPSTAHLAWQALEMYLDDPPSVSEQIDLVSSFGHWLASRERLVDLKPRPGRFCRLLHECGVSAKILGS